MSELLQLSMNSAKQIMRAQAVNANNLANASTDGFRAELAHLMAGGSKDGLGSVADFSPGPIRTTGRPLDVSVNGSGWIAVIGDNGTEGYTRRGDLHVDPLGRVLNGAGFQVLGNNGPVALPPFTSVEVGADGTISIRPLGQGAETMATVDRIKLALPDETALERGEDGLMRLPFGETAAADAQVKLTSGTLEGSNVNAVTEMIKMMDLARQFEAQVRLMRSSQENETQLNKIMSIT